MDKVEPASMVVYGLLQRRVLPSAPLGSIAPRNIDEGDLRTNLRRLHAQFCGAGADTSVARQTHRSKSGDDGYPARMVVAAKR